MKLSPQQQRIVDYMKQVGPITTLDAWSRLGITRLPSRIHELIKMGYPIAKRNIKVVNRYQESCVVTEYRLVVGSTYPA